MTERKEQTLVGLQYLRGLAALFVVIDHVATIMRMSKYLGRGPSEALGFGQVGVDIFFVISGFIITLVSLDAALASRLTRVEFLRRRFVRIVPFLWVCVIGYAVFRLIGRGSFEARPYLAAMFVWPVGELRPNVVWTLRHEALFYLIFGVAMLGAVRRPSLLLLWFASPFVYAALALVTPFPGGTLGQLLLFVANPLNVEFGLGVVLGCLYLKRQSRPLLGVRPGPILVSAAATAVFVLAAVFGLHRETLLGSCELGLVSAVVVCLGLGARARGGVGAFLELLGNASYAIYLTHNIFVLVLCDVMAASHLQPNVYVVEVVIVTLATAGGVAVHLLVEKPIVRLARNLFRPRAMVVGTPAA